MVLAVPFALPFLYLIVRNAGDLGGLWAALTDTDTIAPAFRSLLLGTSVAVTAAILGTGAAWMVARNVIAHSLRHEICGRLSQVSRSATIADLSVCRNLCGRS